MGCICSIRCPQLYTTHSVYPRKAFAFESECVRASPYLPHTAHLHRYRSQRTERSRCGRSAPGGSACRVAVAHRRVLADAEASFANVLRLALPSISLSMFPEAPSACPCIYQSMLLPSTEASPVQGISDGFSDACSHQEPSYPSYAVAASNHGTPPPSRPLLLLCARLPHSAFVSSGVI